VTLRVTVEDLEAGTAETVTVDDYLLVCNKPCHLANRTTHPNGTHTLVVKDAVRLPYSTSTSYQGIA
jgi:hypothetical protein